MQRFNIRVLRFICLLVPALAVLTLSFGVQAGGCLSDMREIKVRGDTIVRMRDYLCTSDRDPEVKIRVQFQRIDEMAAGVLLAGGQAEQIDEVYGKNRKVLPNEVLSEYRTLIKRFGVPMRDKNEVCAGDSPCMDLSIYPAEKETQDGSATLRGTEGSILKWFRLPRVREIPLIDETRHILNKRTWPSALKMYYEQYGPGLDFPIDGEEVPIDVKLWRYLSREDLRDYFRRIRKYNALLAIPNTKQHLRSAAEPKSVSMLKYLTANRWPEKFLFAEAPTIDLFQCTDFAFGITPPSLEVDIAVVENLSGKSIAMGPFNGSAHGGKQLREAHLDPADSPLAIGNINHQGRYTLVRSQKLIIPLRMVFRNIWEVDKAWEKEAKEQSADLYKKIRATKPGTIFQKEIDTTIYGGAKGGKKKKLVIRKVRESFKPPEYPERVDYAFGPEWSLRGFAVDGESISLSKGRTNIIAFTASGGAGSCPILYVWDDKEQHFWQLGKVLHRAQTRARTETQSIRFDGWVSKFRISEEELEVTHLSNVRAFVVLKDGAEHEAIPLVGSAGLGREGALMLAAHEAAEFSFGLPVGIAPEDVMGTRLAVTGYYERYSTLLAKRVLEQRKPQNMTPMADAVP